MKPLYIFAWVLVVSTIILLVILCVAAVAADAYFTVTIPERGIYNMHPLLLEEGL